MSEYATNLSLEDVVTLSQHVPLLHQRRGLFVLIEGADRLGKTTQAKMLVEAINHKNMLKTVIKPNLSPVVKAEGINFPNRSTDIGKIINKHLTKEEVYLDNMGLQLLFAANRNECAPLLKKSLLEEKVVVCDRYAMSAVVYSTVDGCDRDWAVNLNKGLIKPDITFILNADIKVIESRIIASESKELYDRLDFQTKVLEGFKKEGRCMFNNTVYINADRTKEDVHSDILCTLIDDYPSLMTTKPLEYI